MADGGGSFERGLAVISHIAEQGETTVEKTAAALSLPLSTTYRYFRQLRDRGFVTELRGRYGPGPQMIALAGRHLTQAHLAEVGVGVLKEVVDAVGQTAVLIVRVGSRAMCLRRCRWPSRCSPVVRWCARSTRRGRRAAARRAPGSRTPGSPCTMLHGT